MGWIRISLLVVDLVTLAVISSFQDVNGCILGKIVKNLEKGQKGYSYKFNDVC